MKKGFENHKQDVKVRSESSCSSSEGFSSQAIEGTYYVGYHDGTNKANSNFKEFVRELKEDIKSDVKTKWSDEIMAIIDNLSEKYGVGEE